MLPFLIFLRYTTVLLDLFLIKIMMRIDIDWNIISSFTYHFARRNDLTIYIQVWFKVMWQLRKFDKIVTMTCRIISINSTIPFVLILNIYFWNYYVPSRAYAREPPFNHLDSNPLDSGVLTHYFPFISLLFYGRTARGNRIKKVLKFALVIN